jgi:hypothetical protein
VFAPPTAHLLVARSVLGSKVERRRFVQLEGALLPHWSGLPGESRAEATQAAWHVDQATTAGASFGLAGRLFQLVAAGRWRRGAGRSPE